MTDDADLGLPQRKWRWDPPAEAALGNVSPQVAGGDDDFGGPSRLSCALEYPRWHTWHPHRIPARSEQSGGNQRCSGRDGAAGASTVSAFVFLPRMFVRRKPVTVLRQGSRLPLPAQKNEGLGPRGHRKWRSHIPLDRGRSRPFTK